jgi:predicted protein tyrosine phosphatase
VLSLADDRIVIASRTEAGHILSSPTKRRGIRYVVSIGTASDPPPAGLRNVTHRLRLLFEDESLPGRGGPMEDDVRRLIGFSRTVDLSIGRLLIHCQAGISRSAAAAAIMLTVSAGPGNEDEIVEFLRRAYPACHPNLLMLHLADELLQTGGALVKAWSLRP